MGIALTAAELGLGQLPGASGAARHAANPAASPAASAAPHAVAASAAAAQQGSQHADGRVEIDETTLERCRAGDPHALRTFVLTYQHAVFAFLSRMMGSGAHVEDMAQEVFLRAYRALPRFEKREARVSSWLLTIAVRLVLDARKKKRLSVIPLDSSPELAGHGTPETEQRRREIARAFERAAAELSDDQRAVFILAQFHGLSMSEIAAAVNAPENTVKTRLYRARAKLQELLSGMREAV